MYQHILLFAFLLSQFGLQAANIEVCKTCELTSIKDGIAAANDGDIVTVRKGHYAEGNIIVDKTIQLIGIDYPIIDGNNESEIITIMADSVSIQGFQIQNVGSSYLEDRAGIRVKKSDHFLIKGNRLFNTFFGIYLEHSNDGEVSNNELIGEAVEEMNSGNAIHAWYCENILVSDNLVSFHRDGIYFEFVDSSLVKNNVSEDNIRYGLHFMFSNDDDYFQNEFRRNGAGVAVMFSKKINMWENIFEFNWGRAAYGILLKEIYDAVIENNVFRENTIGIYVEGSTRIDYKNNDFERNGWALKISGGCLDNKIHGNNFIANTFNLSLKSAPGNNSFNSNYWSDYSGYDLDKDGIGDVPYYPVKLFNYVVNRTPETIILLRSLFVDLLNFSEQVSPVFTPENVLDETPVMKKIAHADLITTND